MPAKVYGKELLRQTLVNEEDTVPNEQIARRRNDVDT